jgi:membrane protease subunit HflK
LILSNGFEILHSSITALRKGGVLDFTHKGEDILFGLVIRKVKQFAVAGGTLAVVVYILSGFFIVNMNEKGIVKRFGKAIREVGAGLHYRMPQPFEKVDRVEFDEVRTEKVTGAFMLTGDENLIKIEAIIHYRVKDASAFLYNIAKPEEFVRGSLEASLRELVNTSPVDLALTANKHLLQQQSLLMAQQFLDLQSSGIELVSVNIAKDAPPDDVMDAFRDQASAREDKNTYINEARGYEAENIPKARGDAQKALEEAASYTVKKISMAKGDALRFTSRLNEFRKNPDITRKRLLIEALEKTLVNAQKIIVDENILVENTDLWLFKGDQQKIMEEVSK